MFTHRAHPSLQPIISQSSSHVGITFESFSKRSQKPITATRGRHRMYRKCATCRLTHTPENTAHRYKNPWKNGENVVYRRSSCGKGTAKKKKKAKRPKGCENRVTIFHVKRVNEEAAKSVVRSIKAARLFRPHRVE